MRPVIRSLFVLSLFGLIAAHVSVGALNSLLAGTATLSLLDRSLQGLLIVPFGREVAVYAILGVGAICALAVYVAAHASDRHGRGQSYSTW